MVSGKDIRPIALGCPLVEPTGTRISTGQRHVDIAAPPELMIDLLRACDGQTARDDILGRLEQQWDRETLDAFLDRLIEKGALYDSTEISSFVWSFVLNPPAFSRSLSETEIESLVLRAAERQQARPAESFFSVAEFGILRVIATRKSHRAFSGAYAPLEALIQMLWAGYGIVLSDDIDEEFDRHTVPSAGALYPLQLSLVLFAAVGRLPSGIFSVAFKNDGSVGLNRESDDLLAVYQSFIDPLILTGAHGVIVISGEFKITEEKYGNRALLYVPVEAGHVAQNIHLTACDIGIATVEIGGFSESDLRGAMRLPPTFTPLTTIVFGMEGTAQVAESPKASFQIRWMPPRAGTFRLPFNLAFARIPDTANEDGDWSCGRARNPVIAYAKATSEAIEWASCGRPDGLQTADIGSLRNAVQPHQLVSFHAKQYISAKFPCHPWDDQRRYEWKEAGELGTGNSAFVLADCIYFP
jgi:ribosomal protein S12 methylthiotransferase accessory factor